MHLWAAAIQGPLGVKVGDDALRNIHTHQRPVNLQMDGNEQEQLLENIHLHTHTILCNYENDNQSESDD